MPSETPYLQQHKAKFSYYSSMFYRGYTLYWVLLLILFIGFASLPFIEVDVSVQSHGTITSANKMVALSAPLTARVVKSALKENSKVHRGDTLIVLHQSGINNEITSNRKQIALQHRYIDDLKKLLENTFSSVLETALYRKERDDYISSYNAYEGRVKKLSIDFKRTAQLYRDGVVPQTVFQQDSFMLDEARNRLSVFQTSTMSRWETERRNYILAIHNLEGRIESLKQQQNQYVITAPFDGSIIDFIGITSGHILNENQRIAFLSPNEELIAECYISPGDIGFIHLGMPVQLQIETYDYNQWGLLRAEVAEVADDAMLINGQYVYRIRCRLSNNYLEMKNGVRGTLKKGMSLTGRFVITQRSLFQLLFDNIDDWLNPKVLTNKTTALNANAK
ncbi:HlyD family secretion protein [Carboxylicivirga taeanensis]|uniref:HlyD family secretion protein n=1 Tax=Carboxylicivirga taeanensis TaxID=1416875 RepID=UPI003F6E3E3D